jgi:hypothetical protein
MALGCRMLLHEIDGDAHDRDICISSARQIAAVVKLWIRQMKLDEIKYTRETNDKLTNRNKNGHGGPYILNPWYWTADRLIRGARVLRKAGMEKGE